MNTFPASSLAQGGKCTIVINFTPTSAGIKNATLTITSNDSDESVLDVSLTGATSESDIDAVQQIDMGAAQIILTPVFDVITITNLGLAPLNFSAIDITGTDSSSYLVAHDCPGTPTTTGSLLPLSQSESCTVEIRFLPLKLSVSNVITS